MLEQITPLIITYNEAINIDRTLTQLSWAKRIVVIDSHSTDETINIITSYPQVEVFYRDFDSFAKQCNYGLEQINSPWTLSIDADYLMTDQLIEEINSLRDQELINGYFANFKYCVFGRPLKGTLLPHRQVLFKTSKAQYVDDGHAHRVIVKGNISHLKHYIYHDDRKSLSRWLQSQDRYMISEVKKLSQISDKELSIGDKIRSKKMLAPLIIFFYCLILKGGIFDGWRGWYYAFQRTLAEILLSIRLIETNAKYD